MFTGMFPPSFCSKDAAASLPYFTWKGKVKVMFLQAKSPAGGVFEDISSLPPLPCQKTVPLPHTKLN